MIILDTSVWIEYFRGNPPFYKQVSDLLVRNEVLAVSPIFGELLQGAGNTDERAIISEIWNNLPKAPEDELFIRTGTESGRNKWLDKGVGLIDGVILMAARENVSFIWTLDQKLMRLLKPEEKYHPKQA
jgi:predicted nucleic acid-binding protein